MRRENNKCMAGKTTYQWKLHFTEVRDLVLELIILTLYYLNILSNIYIYIYIYQWRMQTSEDALSLLIIINLEGHTLRFLFSKNFN